MKPGTRLAGKDTYPLQPVLPAVEGEPRLVA